MRKMYFPLICFVLTMSSASSFAAPENKKGLLLKINFQWKTSKVSFQQKYDSILPADNHNWTPLGPAKEGVALLGKIGKLEKGTFKVEYMVVNTKAIPMGLNQMSVITQLGQTSNISSVTDAGKISVSLTAEPTDYTEHPITK